MFEHGGQFRPEPSTAVGVVVAATTVASASVPSLPHRTAAQLLAEVGQGTGKPLGPFTATVQRDCESRAAAAAADRAARRDRRA